MLSIDNDDNLHSILLLIILMFFFGKNSFQKHFFSFGHCCCGFFLKSFFLLPINKRKLFIYQFELRIFLTLTDHFSKTKKKLWLLNIERDPFLLPLMMIYNYTSCGQWILACHLLFFAIKKSKKKSFHFDLILRRKNSISKSVFQFSQFSFIHYKIFFLFESIKFSIFLLLLLNVIK